MSQQSRHETSWIWSIWAWLLAGALVSLPWQGATEAESRSADPSLTVRWQETPEEIWWVELTPLANGSPSGAVGAEFAEVPVQQAGRGILCFGGEKAPVGCRELEYAPGTEYELKTGPGVELTGRFLVGELSLGGRMILSPQGLRTPMRFTMPLAREEDSLVRELEVAADGVFRIPRLSRGTYLIEAELDQGPVYRSEPIDVPSAEELREKIGADTPLRLDLGEILLEEGASISFQVTDLEGLPIEGAMVGLDQSPELGKTKGVKGHSDSEGRARLSGVDLALQGRSICFKEGFLIDRQSFEVPSAFVECRLEPLASLEGRWIDGDSEGVSGVSVQIQDGFSEGKPQLAIADADGRFRLDGVPAGTYQLTAAANGYAIERLEIELQPGETRDLEEMPLRPGRELDGIVLERSTLEPVEDARVLVTSPPGAGRSETDAEGWFRLMTDFDRPITLRVTSSRHAPQQVEVGTDQFDSREPLKVLVSAGGRIEAIAIDSDSGLPCEGCRVTFGREGSETTDRDGVARSDILAVGTYPVTLSKVKSLGTLVTVRQSPGVKFAQVREDQTTVVVLGEEVDDLEITLDQPLGPGWKLATHSLGTVATWPLVGGSARVQRRAGEPLDVFLQRQGLDLLRVWISSVNADFDGSRLDLSLPRATVSGGIATADGAPARGFVELRSASNPKASARVVLSNQGRFELPFLRPGQYQLTLDDQGLRTVVVSDGTNELGEFVLNSP
ncbi:MAG: carboxypeptidase-like regulatory domain-containing protein [Thermoanaerobaculia bacterium]|nr:carboxypeptidase-like regulatory domain-containing protein [Thermoanaerobaculia bacterium]